jgi:hypothetical protein
MRNRTINAELGLFILIFFVALGIRLINLNRNALTNAEATLALQALDLARGGLPVLSGQPGYIVSTAFLFFITNASELTARLLPALAGSMLVWAAWLFRPHLGRLPALFLAFFLAIGPGMAAVSRQADGLIFAAAFGLLSAGFLYRQQAVPGGIFAGLALLGGPGIWMGLLIIALAILSFSLLVKSRKVEDTQDLSDPNIRVSAWPWRAALPWNTADLWNFLFMGPCWN